jgi:biotin operon repressor
MGEEQLRELVGFFKALADESRLRMVGILSQKETTGEELAAMLHLHPGTVSHHIGRLIQSGVVSSRTEGYYRIYGLNTDALQEMAKRLLSSQQVKAVAEDVDVGAYDRDVLRNFLTQSGRLKRIPAQRKKRAVILRHIAQELKPNRKYSEKQLDAILKHFDADTAYLRREMIAEKLIARAKGEYLKL